MQVDFLLSKHSNHLRYVLLLIITPTYYILDSKTKKRNIFFSLLIIIATISLHILFHKKLLARIYSTLACNGTRTKKQAYLKFL